MSIQSVANKQAKCVFWRPGESAIWNSSGCKFVPGKSNVTMTTCECDHLTIFGALLDPYGLPVSKRNSISVEAVKLPTRCRCCFVFFFGWEGKGGGGGGEKKASTVQKKKWRLVHLPIILSARKPLKFS